MWKSTEERVALNLPGNKIGDQMGTFHVVSDIHIAMESKVQQALKNLDSTSFISEFFKLKKISISCHSIKPIISEWLEKLALLLISYETKIYL